MYYLRAALKPKLRAYSVTAAKNSVTYQFGGVVYVGMTNETNCALTMLDANGPGFKFPLGTGFSPLPASYEPNGKAAADAALEACRKLNTEEGMLQAREVVFAGLGEPLLRLEALCDALSILRSERKLVSKLRLNSNGLVCASTAQQTASQLSDAGLASCCVQIQTADAHQHRELVAGHDGLGLEDAMAFAAALIEQGVQVECSVVERPGLSLDAAKALTVSLGAGFKIRPYFP